MLTNQKETKRAIKAAVDQAEKYKGNRFEKMMKNQTRTHCAVCGCTPKPDEWSMQVENCCFDCA
tara:strand:+ start:175 stop:366 length:192 start_codon:yes stop_codon:yes gene_type:complete